MNRLKKINLRLGHLGKDTPKALEIPISYLEIPIEHLRKVPHFDL